MEKIWKLLVPVDFCPGCTSAFNLALSLAKKRNSRIYLSHIVSDPQVIDPLYESDIHEKINFKEIKGKIEKEMCEVYSKKANGISEIDTLITKGYAASEIVELAKEVEADLIVMGTHARKILKHAFIGSIAEKVLRTSPCPVLTTKLANEINYDRFEIKNILVPIDFSEHSEKVFELSVKLAGLFNARIHILYVLQPVSFYPYYYGEFFSGEGIISKMEEEVKDSLKSLIREKGEEYKDITYKIQVGEPFQDILETGKSVKADLIVMGTHGRTGFSHLLMGSVAERIVRLADCPVLTVK